MQFLNATNFDSISGDLIITDSSSKSTVRCINYEINMQPDDFFLIIYLIFDLN